MVLYFNIGERSWVEVRDCYDWNDAINKVSSWWDLRECRCVNESDFKNIIKENIVMSF